MYRFCVFSLLNINLSFQKKTRKRCLFTLLALVYLHFFFYCLVLSVILIYPYTVYVVAC